MTTSTNSVRRVAISGSTGFIGSAIVARLKEEGWQVTPIVRPQTSRISSQMTIQWDPAQGMMDAEALDGYEVVIHLAGTNIAGKRWSPAYKDSILQSRIKSTDLLSQTISKLRNPPKLFLSASAVGFYGTHASSEIIDETSSQGNDFLADVCAQWEKATKIVEKVGVRAVQMRFGMVVGKNGGALAKMLPIFNLGLGGKLGHGQQMMSWIALPEIPEIILDLIQNNSLRGPVNLVSPQAVSNAEFTRVLSQAIRRPAVFPVPSMGIKMFFGEMGQTLLLEGANVYPRRLLKAGYKFKYPDLNSVLKAIF